METTNIPDTVNPSQQASLLTDGTPVPDGIRPAGPRPAEYDNPGLPPLDPNDPNLRLPPQVQAAEQPAPPLSVSRPVKMPTNPKPLDKTTFDEISQRSPELSDYIIPDIFQGKFQTFRSTAGYNLPFNFGFSNLDAIQAVVPGLYVLGAASSMGKTTFALQLADQIAFQDHPVLFFSREMSTIDMVTKSLSRLINQQASHDPLYHRYTALDIKQGRADGSRELAEQIDFYKTHGKSNIAMIKLNSETDITYIINFIRDFMETTGKRPVVIIDYLQIIGSTKMILPDGRTRVVSDNRENIQRILELAKDFQLNNNLMMLMVCSLNRSSYTDALKYEAFKETGAIEYTADVVWGLQLSVMSKKRFADAIKASQTSSGLSDILKRQLLSVEKAKAQREITLKCLKNRSGIPEYEIDFIYETPYDTYIPRATSTNSQIDSDTAAKILGMINADSHDDTDDEDDD